MKTFGGSDRGEYLAPVVTVDVVSIRLLDDGTIGFAQYVRGREPEKGKRALPGAYVYRGDKLLDLAKRVLWERCGVFSESMRLIMAADDTERDERGPSVSFVYLETGNLSTASHVNILPDGFDHSDICMKVFSEIQKTYSLEVMKELLPEKFTLRQAYELFNTLSSDNVDRANFINSNKKLWRGTGEKQAGAGRPAELYSLL